MNRETNQVNKKWYFFYTIELVSAIALTIFDEFSGLMWLAVAISYLGLIAKLPAINLSVKISNHISQMCLILSSILWGYIIMYYLSASPIIYTILLIARILSTIIAFKDIKQHIIVVIPLLIGFALLKQAGCIPPIAF
jgi:hypothetical protein